MSLDIWAEDIIEKECDCCGNIGLIKTELFSMNITHNLKQMAIELGCDILWDTSINDKSAKILIKPVRKAVHKLHLNMAVYKEFDAPNGWGTAEQFLPWLEQLLEYCQENPNGILGISK